MIKLKRIKTTPAKVLMGCKLTEQWSEYQTPDGRFSITGCNGRDWQAKALDDSHLFPSFFKSGKGLRYYNAESLRDCRDAIEMVYYRENPDNPPSFIKIDE